jgi:hypothetical protein
MNNIQIHLMNIYRIRLKTCAYIKEEVELCNLRQRTGDSQTVRKTIINNIAKDKQSC